MQHAGTGGTGGGITPTITTDRQEKIVKLELYMNMDNDSFASDPGAEAGRILRAAAQQLRAEGVEVPANGVHMIRLHDSNGNRVGYATVTK